MSTTTVSKLATALKIKPEKLISQLNDAGITAVSYTHLTLPTNSLV